MTQLQGRGGRVLQEQVVYQSNINGIDFDVPKEAHVNEYFAHPQKQSFVSLVAETQVIEAKKTVGRPSKSATVEIE